MNFRTSRRITQTAIALFTLNISADGRPLGTSAKVLKRKRILTVMH